MSCLLPQMPEEQAFSVLVKIMFDYGLRELFKQNFEDLHCKFFQLERLMQVRNITNRNVSNWRIRPKMYSLIDYSEVHVTATFIDGWLWVTLGLIYSA